MARFFIDRPVFAWVIAIGTMLIGLISLRTLPVSRYPEIAPPTVSINATYNGASAQAVEDSVTQVLEQQLTALDGLRYITSRSTSQGAANVQLTFETGTDPDVAQVQVQNRVQQATRLLPTAVQTQGVSVTKSGDEQLMLVALVSDDPSMTASDLADYVATSLQIPISRIAGVGSVTLFGAQYAMRIWLDPARLVEYKLTPADVTSAVAAQNTQVSVGQLGAQPTVAGQQLNATVTAQSRLQTAEQFRNILLLTTTGGANVLLRDVATVEVGSENYNFLGRYNGKPAAGMMVYLATGANATDTAQAVRTEVARLSATFPAGVRAEAAYDTTPFIKTSIEEVVRTLLEAIALVFVVMFLFLQNWRATLIPMLAVPVVLLGTFASLAAFGFTINTLTMFAMVLAIGLLVDDAIVVVENVERLMAEEHLPALEATRQSMDQISGALVGVALVLSAVFLPMAFFGGTTGVIYRQFSVTIVSAMLLSVLVALIFTPALCATLLRPGGHGGRRLFAPFNRFVERTTRRYEGSVASILHGRRVVSGAIYLALAALMVWLYLGLPTSFVPEEDQGVLMVTVTLPPGATQARTIDVLSQVEKYFAEHEPGAVASVFTVAGFGTASSGQNSGMGFIRLADWADRDEAHSVQAIQARAAAAFGRIKDATVFATSPASIPGLGQSMGFTLQLLDAPGTGADALTDAATAIVRAGAAEPTLQGVRINAPDKTAQYVVDIDQTKAGALGVSVADLNNALSTAWGGTYVNDFIDRGRVKKVYVQSTAEARMLPEDLGKWSVRNGQSEMVSFASFATGRWTTGLPQLSRFDGTSTVQILGSAASGTSSGTAMTTIERIANQAAPGYGVAWSGLSYEERLAGANATSLYVFSLLVVFLCLAALYESWSVPLAVLLVMPLGLLGTVAATAARSLSNDVFFQVALLTIVGLTAKNAILIVEFAKAAVDRGEAAIAATVRASAVRLRPIVMTSLAFGLGVLPLAVGRGAGAGSQHAVGTGVAGGMVTATLLGVFFVPVSYVLVHGLLGGRRRDPAAVEPTKDVPASSDSDDAAEASGGDAGAGHSGS